ncbi:DUF1175 family protein [Terriglobus sp. TAA 43]|uniref:DUF1175 family protein n=1 Tax=Terriglobus sp. TAA 43 TaxID=278961 RepID=UPI00068C7256|nr:DUF1175 family protein [Terriglobus sp. TAA 43]
MHLIGRLIAGVSAVLLLIALLLFSVRRSHAGALVILEQTLQIPADGRFHRLGLVTLKDGSEIQSSEVSVSEVSARIPRGKAKKIELTVQAPVNPETRTVRVSYGESVTTLKIHFVPSLEDSFGDGTPDLLRLHSAEDRSAFRGWFTAMAEAAADLPKEKVPNEINDCAALLRWSYRNALHAHDEAWLSTAPVSIQITRPSVGQYLYPLTPLRAALFRVKEGAFVPSDVENGAFAQFADAHTLWRLNTFFLSRNPQSTRPGDLLFFRQLEQNSPYHSMIITGTTQQWVIYHTGPIGHGPGEIRRVLLQDLLEHPDPRWRPNSQNSNFLGVYRWNILREDP